MKQTENKIQQHEVDVYRIKGKHPDRIKQDATGNPFVVGDLCWNQQNPQRRELFEPILYPEKRAYTIDPKALAEVDKRNTVIRKRRAAGELLESIAVDFTLSRERVRQICTGLKRLPSKAVKQVGA